MKLPLKKLADVRIGYSFRSRLEPAPQGNLAVVQMKDLLDDNTVDCSGFVRIDTDAIKPHHLARKGDLVFRTRGNDTTSAIIMEDPGCAVVASPLIRIRVKDTGRLLPEYLNWYISQREAQVFIASRAKGTVQKMVTKQGIEDLEVILPSLEHQRMIVELATLAARERHLLQQLITAKKRLISGKLIRYAKAGEE